MQNSKIPITFKSIALEKFDAPSIAKELLDPTTFSEPIRGVLLSGFLAWVVRPRSSKLRIRAMRIAAREVYVRQLEAAVAERSPAKSLSARSIIEAFRGEVIDAFGREKVIDGMSHAGFRKDLAKDRSDIVMVHRIVDIWQWCLIYGQPTSKQKISQQKAALTIEEYGKKIWGQTLSERKLREKAKRFGKSVAFSYSASRMTLADGKSLLDAIFENSITLKHFDDIKSEWFSLAKTVSKEVLEAGPESHLTRTRLKFERLSTVHLAPSVLKDDNLLSIILLSNGYKLRSGIRT